MKNIMRMKCITKASLLVIAAFFGLTGCFGPVETAITETWSVSGTFNLTGTNSDPLFIAPFYNTSEDTDTKIQVGDPVSVTNGGTFTVTVDASMVAPADESKIYLYVFQDEDGSGSYTTNDERVTLDADTGCAVFADSTYASFVYYVEADSGLFGHAKGWNVDKSFDDDVSVDTATLSGAVVSNWLEFWD